MAQPIIHKKKAMTSEKASIVKKAGHSNESEFADLIGGQVIPGQGKADVVKNGANFSLKKYVSAFKSRFTPEIANIGPNLHHLP